MTHPPSPTDPSYLMPPPDPTLVAPTAPGERGWRRVFPPALPPDQREWLPGTMGIATASLVCGLLGFLPFVGTAALVLGILALVRLRRVDQKGRGAAITGVVLGLVATLAFVNVMVDVVREHGRPSGSRVPGQLTSALRLKVGDCFNGVPGSDVKRVGMLERRACTDPHEAQAAWTLSLPDGPWPGIEAAGGAAMEACSEEVVDDVREADLDAVELVTFYPNSAFAWRQNHTVVCVLTGADGAMLDHSVLEAT